MSHDDDHREDAIYYISCSLIDYKTRYSPVEKLYLAIMFSAFILYARIGNEHYVVDLTLYITLCPNQPDQVV